MDYVIKVGAQYFSGSDLVDGQTNAMRYDVATRHRIGDDGVRALFGDGARFVRIRPRAMFAQPDDMPW